MRSLSEDLGVVYAHMVLPSALEDELPSVSEGWGDFNGGDAAEAALEMLGDNGRPGRFEDWLRSIRPSSQPSLNFKHTLLPHVPWQYLPDGRAYSAGAGVRPAWRTSRRWTSRSSSASSTSATCCSSATRTG